MNIIASVGSPTTTVAIYSAFLTASADWSELSLKQYIATFSTHVMEPLVVPLPLLRLLPISLCFGQQTYRCGFTRTRRRAIIWSSYSLSWYPIG